jgi:hypothetical protein
MGRMVDEVRPPASDERGPVLFTTDQCTQWKERIEREVDTAGRLKKMIENNKAAALKVYYDRGPPKCMPMPPTTFALQAARFNTTERRMQAARAVKALSTEWPQGVMRTLSQDSIHSMTFKHSSPHQLLTRPTPWR